MRQSRLGEFITSDNWSVGYSRPIVGVTSNDVNLSREPVDTRGSLYVFLVLLAGLAS